MHKTILLAAALLGTAAMAAERGTIGAGMMQLYDERAPEKRGMLVVLQVEKGSPAEKAGVQVGDLVIAIDKAAVRGRPLDEIAKRDLHGPPGATLALSLFRMATQSQVEARVERIAYKPLENPATDAFHYVAPGDWHPERHDFPLQWAPQLAYRGLLDLRFAPEFNDPKSDDYSSYFFVWWLEGAPKLDAHRLEQDLVTYYSGLNASMAQVNGTKPGAAQESASLKQVSDGKFAGLVTSFDPSGKVEPRHGEVEVKHCADHTAVLFSISPKDRASPVWKQLDTIRDSFTCTRT